MCVSIFIYPTMLLPVLSAFFFRDSSSSFFFLSYICLWKTQPLVIVDFFLLRHTPKAGEKAKNSRLFHRDGNELSFSSSFILFLSSFSIKFAQTTARHCKKNVVHLHHHHEIFSRFFLLLFHNYNNGRERATVEFPCTFPSSYRSLPI